MDPRWNQLRGQQLNAVQALISSGVPEDQALARFTGGGQPQPQPQAAPPDPSLGRGHYGQPMPQGNPQLMQALATALGAAQAAHKPEIAQAAQAPTMAAAPQPDHGMTPVQLMRMSQQRQYSAGEGPTAVTVVVPNMRGRAGGGSQESYDEGGYQKVLQERSADKARANVESGKGGILRRAEPGRAMTDGPSGRGFTGEVPEYGKSGGTPVFVLPDVPEYKGK